MVIGPSLFCAIDGRLHRRALWGDRGGRMHRNWWQVGRFQVGVDLGEGGKEGAVQASWESVNVINGLLPPSPRAPSHRDKLVRLGKGNQVTFAVWRERAIRTHRTLERLRWDDSENDMLYLKYWGFWRWRGEEWEKGTSKKFASWRTISADLENRLTSLCSVE